MLLSDLCVDIQEQRLSCQLTIYYSMKYQIYPDCQYCHDEAGQSLVGGGVQVPVLQGPPLPRLPLLV